MHERAADAAAQQQKAFDQYVRQAAGTPGADTTSQLSKLADLKSQGVLTDAEFEAQKAKILASLNPGRVSRSAAQFDDTQSGGGSP